MAVLRQSPDQKGNVSLSGSELQGKRNRALLNHSRASSSARSNDAEKSGQYYRFNPLPYKGVAVRLYLRTACGLYCDQRSITNVRLFAREQQSVK